MAQEGVRSEETSLAIMERAEILLVEANTVQKAKDLKTLALTAMDWARRKGFGKKTEQHCYSYAMRAEIKMGEMLAATEDERAKGAAAGGKKTSPRGSYTERRDDTPTLADLGVTKKESAQAQMLASLSKAKQEAVIVGTLKRSEARRQLRRDGLKDRIAALPEGKFRVIYADPPWHYNDQRLTGDHRESTAATYHYPTMSLAELEALNVRKLAAEDSVLFLWATFPLIPDALTILRAWGFTYKTAFIWHKPRGSFGHYHKADAELLLVSTHGSCTPEMDTRTSQIIAAATSGHSRKPEKFRQLIDVLYEAGPRIELFARGPGAKGWTVHGNEAGR